MKKLNNKQRIALLEKEVTDMKKFILMEISKLNEFIGITPDYQHEPVKPIKLK